MKRFYGRISVLLALITVVGISCSKSDDPKPSDSGLDRKPMFENYANNYIVPAYSDMVTKLIDLKNKLEAFTNSPDATTKTAAVSSFRTAYTTWQKVDLLEFGPADEISLRTYMNIYPVTISKLDGNITSGSYDLEAFGNKDAQGFPAIDYLLNGISIDQFTTDAQANNRKQYLMAVINKMLEKVQKVSNDWSAYKTTFTNNTSTDVNSSLSIMVNNFVMYYERYLRGAKVGLPVGAMTGLSRTDLSEAYYSQEIAKGLLLTSLNSVKSYYMGNGYNAGGGESMKSYLAALGTKDNNGTLIADVIVKELDEAIAAVNGLNGTIVSDIQNNRTQVVAAYEAIQEVVALFKVDMVSAFSISITYTDNDGD